MSRPKKSSSLKSFCFAAILGAWSSFAHGNGIDAHISTSASEAEEKAVNELLMKHPVENSGTASGNHNHHRASKHVSLHPDGHHHKNTTAAGLANEVSEEAERKAKKEIKEANAKPICQPAYALATKACTSRMGNSSSPRDVESYEHVTGVSKISEADAHMHHHEGDQNAIYAGECRAYAGSCIDVCSSEKTPEANNLLSRCKSYDRHADKHEAVAVIHYQHQIQAIQIAMGTSESSQENGNNKDGSQNSGSGSDSKGQGDSSDGRNGFGSMADRLAALNQGRAFIEKAFGDQSGAMSAQSINPSFGVEAQPQGDLQSSAERDIRNSEPSGNSTEAQQADWSNAPDQSEISNSAQSSDYQTASSPSFAGGGRIPSSGSMNVAGGSGSGGDGGGAQFGRGGSAKLDSPSAGTGAMKYEPMYRMIKVGNVDAASGNGSSSGRSQDDPKSINLSDYLPNGSQYQNGYSPSGMDMNHQQIQPQATNIWGLISDRTRTLCAQKRLYDCNGH